MFSPQETSMRFVAPAFLALMLALAPLTAQAGTNFGGFFCRQHFTCDISSPTYPTSAQIVSIANNCTGGSTPTSSSSLFDDSTLPDSSGCFSSNPSTGGFTVTQCCIKPISDQECGVYCAAIGQ
jgi:hypothetical protein